MYLTTVTPRQHRNRPDVLMCNARFDIHKFSLNPSGISVSPKEAG
jgi:hypothetical protein